jgi:hypothetical protein
MPKARSARSRSLDDYFAEVVARLRGIASADLVGVYVGGSYALRAYQRDRSDIDMAAIVAKQPSQPLKDAVVGALRHEALPCPARGLELVVYTAEAVREPSTEAAFELNLNTGARMPFRVDFEPDPDEAHWFPIDRSILAQHGVALFGPPAADVFGVLGRSSFRCCANRCEDRPQ